MSVRHHMNYLSPYARGIVHGFAWGFAFCAVTTVAVRFASFYW